MADVDAVPDGEGRPRRASVVLTVDPDGRLRGLPGRVRPEDWVTGRAEPAVPGSVLDAENERRPEGGFRYDPAG